MNTNRTIVRTSLRIAELSTVSASEETMNLLLESTLPSWSLFRQIRLQSKSYALLLYKWKPDSRTVRKGNQQIL